MDIIPIYPLQPQRMRRDVTLKATSPRRAETGSAASWWRPLAAGTVSGVILAGVFNPFDRALYLSVVVPRPLFHAENWKQPFQGASNALLHRTVSGGLYFALYDIIHEPVKQHLRFGSSSDWLVQKVAAGNLAGFANGVLLNPMAAVKYAAWGDNSNQGLRTIASDMWRKGGARPFINGILPTICRDMVFGGVYAGLRHVIYLRLHDTLEPYEFTRFAAPTAQFVAAAVATMLSSPFNYWRNMQFATDVGERPAGIISCARSLAAEVAHENRWHGGLALLQDRLRIGWGTMRVGAGMMIGQQIFDVVMSYLEEARA